MADDAQPWNRHVYERWNSPERARAIEEAARIEAAAREAYTQSETVASAVPAPREEKAAPLPASVSRETVAADSSRPQSVTEVLFNYAAGFAGVPGLAPRQGVDGSLDEGLGFHQDGTARRAGGVAGQSGPSDRGQRSRAYMQSGLQNGYGANFGQSGLYGDMHYDLWGRDDPTRGGRISGQSGYSRELGDFDPMGMALDRGLNWGTGLVNSMGEAALSGLVDGGRARLNFHLDKDGYFGGEGDALLPFWDSQYSTAFVQLGGRSMHDESDTRWIGNLGIGQRWFPAATEDDSGNWMVGYNAFFDYDFTRDHQCGGVGIEAQYDWLRLASNYYFPLSNWKGSEDFDSDFVKERAAKGWDVRAKGYLPFYRNLAVTGAYSQWYGDHVGMFGASNLEKDPKVWSYGLEYTPVPLVSGFVTQKSTERGRTDTEFGLTFTYHFQMPWEDQVSHSKVAELRTVSGSRHEFVDRENRIILEYKAKNSYHIESLGPDGSRGFLFRIRDGFGKYKAGQTVRVTAQGNYLAEAAKAEPQGFFAQAVSFLDDLISVKAAYAADLSKTYVTDGQGRFWVQLDPTAPVNTSVTVQAGENSQTFILAGGGGGPSGPNTEVRNNNQPADNSSEITARARFFDADGVTPVVGQTVNWLVQGAPAGITLGTGTATDNGGWSEITVKDGQIGNRSITLEATYSGTTRTVSVSFGAPVLTLSSIQSSNATPGLGGNSNVTVEVKFADTSAAANLSNTSITWKTRNNASASATASTSNSGTDGTGKATFTATANFRHVMYVEASDGSSSLNTTVQFGDKLPDGFIAVAASNMNWYAAGTYCTGQGGKLPDSLSYTFSGGGTLPNGDDYWSGVEVVADNARILHSNSAVLIGIGFALKDNGSYSVVCVPSQGGI